MKRQAESTQTKVVTRVADLVRLLDQMRSLYAQMFAVIDRKLVAMRAADVSAMTALASSERVLSDRLREREGLRRQLMKAIGQELGLPREAGRHLKVSQLANRLVERERTSLLAATERLRAEVANVAQANRVAGTVAREVVSHVRWIFAAVRPDEQKPTGYSNAGVTVSQTPGPLFDAVG